MATPSSLAHPKGLYLLFFTEMWERFSYYGMVSLLMTYMVTNTANGGMGFDTMFAGQLFGAYVGLVYFTPIIGAYIADKFLGSQLCILIGAFFMVLGHFSLAFSSNFSFYLGIGLLIVGVGFFKANISSIVGKLYDKDSPLMDSAYTIFYMGINVGSIFGTLLCSYLGERVGWHYGFGIAGVGMAISFFTFYLGKKWLGEAGKYVKLAGRKHESVNLFSFDSIQKDRIMVIFVLSVFSIFFWMAWQQMGSSISLFALNHTDRYIKAIDFIVPVGWFQSLNPIFVSILAPLFAAMWIKLAQNNLEMSLPAKIAVGMFIMGIAFLVMVLAAGSVDAGISNGQVSMWFLVVFYFFQVIAEIFQYPVCLSAVSKLSPKNIYTIMFGVYLTSLAIGNYLSGAISGYIEQITKGFSLSWFFGFSVLFVCFSGVCLLILSPKLKKMMHSNTPL